MSEGKRCLIALLVTTCIFAVEYLIYLAIKHILKIDDPVLALILFNGLFLSLFILVYIALFA